MLELFVSCYFGLGSGENGLFTSMGSSWISFIHGRLVRASLQAKALVHCCYSSKLKKLKTIDGIIMGPAIHISLPFL